MKRIPKAILSLLPAGVRRALRERVRALRARSRLRGATRYDMQRFSLHSGMKGLLTRPSHAAAIIKTYHRIEKGLALPEPRPGFGVQAVAQLLHEVETYIDVYQPDEITRAALNALNEYLDFNGRCDAVLDAAIVEGVDRLRARQGDIAANYGFGGTQSVTREGIHAASEMDLAPFFASRYSVRQFSGKPIDLALIEKAAAMAQKTPSVCNREAGRVAVISDKALMRKAFSHQNGNRGFGEHADKLLIVAADQACFLNVGERYQPWIDGGMYAMSLVYALHSLGLGSCCLNWSVEPDADLALRKDIGLPEQWTVIMMIAVGHLPEHFSVAQSPRRPLSDVFRVFGDAP